MAEGAAVSLATIHNDVGTKGDLLMTAVALEEEARAAGCAIVVDPMRDPATTLHSLTCRYCDHWLGYRAKEMRRSAAALFVARFHPIDGGRWAEIDARLSHQVARLVARGFG
ncbi:hypothetical protein [Rubellimicrobium roseum]|uniref:Uncharacterized protein n=1 Tax=Rubellimicrobium roseum TaxID=687525 RepID=A0A5C4NA93_9RHOB|nr:hypothetical protein [Rubellimicrobium roseum]TNC65040.1 hypothetical protein FHG71_18125 [Rubellimicrobium roseum]